MLTTKSEQTVCGDTCNGVHEDCVVQQRGLAAVAHAIGYVNPSHSLPDAVVVHCPKERAPQVGLTQRLVVGVIRLASG